MVTNRVDLARYFGEKGYTRGAEIGVADGRYSRVLFDNVPKMEELILVDPWAPYEGNWRSAEYQQQALKTAQERVEGFPARFLIMESVKASILVPDESLDFVFIDGDHVFDAVITDIVLWAKKVRKGGIVAGHDYYNHRAGGVIAAVNSYVEAHKIDVNFTIKGVAEHKDDQCVCWWFEKQ